MFYRWLMRGSFGIGLPICVVVSLVGASVRPAAGAAELGRPTIAAAAGAQAGEFLGFDLEEERHYVLGPPESLGRNELATWDIRLDSVVGAGASRRATFTLEHRREAPRSLENPVSPGHVTIAQVDATLVVNAHGAPLEISYVSQRHIYDVGDESFQVEYTYRNGRYKKRVSLQGAEWDFDIDLIEHPRLDPDVPVGLFTFAPQALDCMEWLDGTVIERRTGTGDTGPRGQVQTADRQGTAMIENAALGSGSCYERNTDPAFANPGLLSLAMSMVWEQRGDGELVLFSPLRPDLVRSQDIGVPVTFSPIIPSVPMVPGSNVLSGTIPGLDFFRALIGGGGTDGDKERAKDPRRYFFPNRMKLSERQRIEVGSRTMEALPLEISGFAGTAWVDDWGKVLRLDLPAQRFGEPERWVRILHPSEY